jgi:hypothetical protein
METVDKMINKRFKDDTFMTRNQFQKCFQLSDALAYSLFRLFDPAGDGRAMSLDVWGALVLSCSARVEEKLKLLFELADTNGDNLLGSLDCELLMRCVSRGFSRLKGIPAPAHRYSTRVPLLSLAGTGPVAAQEAVNWKYYLSYAHISIISCDYTERCLLVCAITTYFLAWFRK